MLVAVAVAQTLILVEQEVQVVEERVEILVLLALQPPQILVVVVVEKVVPQLLELVAEQAAAV
jgi:hypothetical protein